MNSANVLHVCAGQSSYRQISRRKLFPAVVFMAMVKLSLTIAAQSRYTELFPSDPSFRGYFGNSVDIELGYVLVAAPGHYHGLTYGGPDVFNTGCPIYFYLQDEYAGWNQELELFASGQQHDDFLRSCESQGGELIIGAPGDNDYGPHSGTARVYEHDGSGWIERLRIVPAENGGNQVALFGYSIASSGDWIVFGARGDNWPNQTGSVYLFRRYGDSWHEVAKLVPAVVSVGAELGTSVAIEGTVVVGGAYNWTAGCDPAVGGTAYIWEEVPTGDWVETAQLCHADPVPGDAFGISVDISGGLIAIGAYRRHNYRGSVYLYEKVGAEWVEVDELQPEDDDLHPDFGFSLDLEGDLLVIGAPAAEAKASFTGAVDLHLYDGVVPGAVYVFERRRAGWKQVEKLWRDAGESGDQTGYSVALSGGLAAAGAISDDVGTLENAGSAIVFEVGRGTRYCSSRENSRRAAAQIAATGSLSIEENDFRLHASPVPIEQPGTFVWGSQRPVPPFSRERLCVGGELFLMPFRLSKGEVLFGEVDFTVPPFVGNVIAGSRWNIQAWFHDPWGSPRWNSSDAVSVVFEP